MKGRRRLPRTVKKLKEEDREPIVKAVMFAPCTKGSKLTKELREAENELGKSTGAKLKIVERCGTKIADILTTADPWKSKDCLRESCLLCKTKSHTGKLLTQDCKRRSTVYETYCITCKERMEDEIEKKYEDTEEEEVEKRKKFELENIKLYKYIGETGKSAYERGLQHLNDAAQLKPGSHLLKHYFDNHEDEKFDDMKFGMRIRMHAKSAFERQIQESVLIQQESGNHNILNSRSEYNRCALPRLTTKLGDEEFSIWKKELLEEKKKEIELEGKIRKLKTGKWKKERRKKKIQ